MSNKKRYTKTGLEWDKKNARTFNARTKRIENALLDIEANLSDYRTKPTRTNLADKAKVSVEMLRDRALEDARANDLIELDDNGIALLDEKGNPIPAKYGWPLSEFIRIQKAWRFMKEETTKQRSSAIRKSSNPIVQTKKDANIPVATEKYRRVVKQVENYRLENSRQKYEMEDLKEQLNQATESSENMVKEINRINKKCSEMAEEILSLRNQLKSTKKSNLKVVE